MQLSQNAELVKGELKKVKGHLPHPLGPRSAVEGLEHLRAELIHFLGIEGGICRDGLANFLERHADRLSLG